MIEQGKLRNVAMPRGVDLFVAAENLFNDRYETGKTPVTTIGPPILCRERKKHRIREPRSKSEIPIQYEESNKFERLEFDLGRTWASRERVLE